LPGVDDALAARILATRSEVDGFSSLEDFGTVMDVEGRLVEGLRERAIFLPPA
jgi:DNA uptake protein ComE-like DNA-binding protein